jgi:hypothetical protein
MLDQEGLDDVLREPVPVHVHMVPRVAAGGRGANSVSQNVVPDAEGSYTFLNYCTVLDQEKNYLKYVKLFYLFNHVY